MTTQAIFEYISQRMCLVCSQGTTATGSFLNTNGGDAGIFVSTLHSIVHPSNSPEDVVGFDYTPSIIYLTENYNSEINYWKPTTPHENDIISYMYEVARKVDLVLFKVIGLKSPDYFETLPPDETLDVGEEVYFGGFPLHMSNPAFHKGFISSKQEVDGRLYYTIDGTVVPGHSGGPVVVNKGGSTGLKIYLVGIILSEAVSLDREHQRLIEANRRYKQKCPNPIPPKFTIFNAKSDEKIEKDLVDLILAVDNFVSRNLSTGIGQMIESSAIYDLINNQYQETEAVKTNSVNPEDFPIGVKNEKLPGMLSQDNDYLNWYHRRVKGNYLCVKILNVMIKGGRDEITAEQEKRLWDYYEKNVFTKRAAERLEREKGKVTKAELTNDPKGNLENILHSIKEKHSALSRPNRPLTDKAIKNRQLEISNLLIKGNESLELIENEDEKAIFALRLSNYRDGSA